MSNSGVCKERGIRTFPSPKVILLPFKTTKSKNEHLLRFFHQNLLLSNMATRNTLIVFQRCHCFLNSTGYQWVVHSQDKNFCLYLIMSTHGLRGCRAWITLERIYSAYNECLRVPYFSDPFSSCSFPLLPSFFSVTSSIPGVPLSWFLKVCSSVVEDRPKWWFIPDSLALILQKQQMFLFLILANSRL